MRLVSIRVAATLLSAPALAQQIQRSSNPQGVQIQGNTEIRAKQVNATAVTVGKDNEASNEAGVIGGK